MGLSGASTAMVFGAFDVLYSNRCLMGKAIAKANEKRCHRGKGRWSLGPAVLSVQAMESFLRVIEARDGSMEQPTTGPKNNAGVVVPLTITTDVCENYQQVSSNVRLKYLKK